MLACPIAGHGTALVCAYVWLSDVHGMPSPSSSLAGSGWLQGLPARARAMDRASKSDTAVRLAAVISRFRRGIFNGIQVAAVHGGRPG